jgi:hypothetical protein
MTIPVPEPVRGGTWIYCRHEWSTRRAGGNVTWFSCLSRFRREKNYRRHWRKYHAGSRTGG